MPVPKRRLSRARRDRRRASNNKLRAPAIVICPNCLEPMMPHHACPSCGQYNGRLVQAPQFEEEAEAE